MKNVKGILYKNRIFFTGILSCLFAGSLVLLFTGIPSLSFSSQNPHPFWLNVFFINYTFMGDGFFAMALIALYLFYFKKKQEGLALLNAVLLSGITVQLVKNLFTSSGPRLFFEQGQYLFFTDGISSANTPGLPSGHTAIAFAIATVLIVMMKSKKWQLPVLIAAGLVGYSRIYLAQHFLPGVLTGALIGTSCGIVSLIIKQGHYSLLNSINTSSFSGKLKLFLK